MKRIFTLLCAVCLSIAAYSVETTYSFASSLPDGWTASVNPYGFETADPARGTQFTASSNLSLSGLTGVTEVRIVCSTNVDNANSIGVTVGGTSFGSNTLTKVNNTTLTYTGASSDGTLVIAITRTSKSVYIKEVVITSSTAPVVGPGNPGSQEDPSTSLDPAYVYSEPTVVTNTDSTGNNITYSFVQNNIKVDCTRGARTSTFFSCNAGYSLTLTASKSIKALVINGQIKQNFTATASTGQIAYADASADAVEANPVLVVTDINATSVTISCVKQMRCYSVAFYFEANPDIELGGEEDEDYSYEWENTEKVTLNLVFDEIETADMSEDLGYACSYIGLANDEYELELDVFAALEANGLPAAGTYPINDSYDPNTVMASVGGTDEFDFPSVLFGDFYEEEGEWYYNSVYYLVGGTMEIANVAGGTELRLNATSYYGSTIKTTYLVGADAVEQIAAEDKALKTIEHGQIIIRRGEQKFSLLGTKID